MAEAARCYMLTFTLLLCLNKLPAAAARDDAHFLSYHIAITPNPRYGQLWCEIQGWLDGNMFLKYHCENEAKPVVHQGMKVEILKDLETQEAAMKEVAEEIKKKLLEMKQITTASDPLSLQVKLKCEKEANGCTHGSWEFGFDGQTYLLFDSKKIWTEFHPEGRELKKTLSHDSDLTKLLVMVSNGDCWIWLEEVLAHWDELLDTAVLQTVTTTGVGSKSAAITPMSWILMVLLTCTIMMLF
ncbi:UL16-binding protein 1-like [Sorex araneus]|uniref:UL16-binding protein 1-like n=1 Tax=Sorex araneus TaxID=42254 RepID=UPI00064A7753|nr:UL16-binding protein 1-like [Sorex araneus]